MTAGATATRYDPSSAVSRGLAAGTLRLRAWLFDTALSLWWDRGADHERGGFFDQLALHGAESPDLPKRVRVQARQIIVFAEAGRLGWQGPWPDAVAQGLAFLPCYRRGDGLYCASVDANGMCVASTPDLYDQAFVLFAFAAAFRALGQPAALCASAVALLERLDALLAHPVAGYREEASPPRTPLRSNPHMHLLEAMLAWVAAGVHDPFTSVAHAIVRLARERLIDPRTGAIGELYDDGWAFAAGAGGRVREPGHQFEWAYLLDEAQRLLGGDHCRVVADLLAFGAFGVIDGRVVSAVDHRGRITDASCRLWAQTERLRAMIRMQERASGPVANACGAAALESLETVERFLYAAPRGLWRERMDLAGGWIDESAPASSLYHLVTAIAGLPIQARSAQPE